MSPITAERHPDLLEKAQAEIRRYVCSSFRSWPICEPTNKPVELETHFSYDIDRGDILEAFFVCRGCGR